MGPQAQASRVGPRRGRQVRERRAAPPRAWAPEAAGRAGEASSRSRGPGTRGGEVGPLRRGRRRQRRGRKRRNGWGWGVEEVGAEGRCPARYPAHRASVLNDDLLGQHDTAVRSPFLLLPLGHFTIVESWRCCSHSRGGRPQRRVPSRRYCRAEPLWAPAAILRARPASGGASHRAMGRRACPAPPRARDAAGPARQLRQLRQPRWGGAAARRSAAGCWLAAGSWVFRFPARFILQQPGAVGSVTVTFTGEDMSISGSYLLGELRLTNSGCTLNSSQVSSTVSTSSNCVVTKTGTEGNS